MQMAFRSARFNVSVRRVLSPDSPTVFGPKRTCHGCRACVAGGAAPSGATRRDTRF